MYVTPMGTEPLVLLVPCSRHLKSGKVQTSVQHIPAFSLLVNKTLPPQRFTFHIRGSCCIRLHLVALLISHHPDNH